MHGVVSWELWPLKNRTKISRLNVRLARTRWGDLSKTAISRLRNLSEEYAVSVAPGDLQLLDGHWYVTHAGLLRMAHLSRCVGIRVQPIREYCDAASRSWVFRATVYKSSRSKGFVGYGDADPSNVSSMVHGAEMRVAETRAVNRALRKAYGIGLCSVEELGAFSTSPRPSSVTPASNGSGFPSSHGSGKPQPRLRDQLCLLIREFKLDPNLVKSYAADFCGTETLSEASRKSVESFVSHLTATAKGNRDALICKLNSYAQSVEARS